MTTGHRNVSRRAFSFGLLGVSAMPILAACGSGAQAGASGASSASGGGGGVAAFANKGMNYFFFVTQNEAIKRKSEELGLSFQTTNANHDSNQQFNDWNSLLVSSPVMMIADPIDSEGLASVVKQSKDRGIPVGIVDTPLTQGEADFTIAFDNYRAGEMAAERTVELLTERYGEPKGKVLNAYGALTSSAWRARKEGFEAVLGKHDGITLLSRPTEGDEANARSVAGATLSEHADLDAAHAPSDAITRGIVTTLQAEKRTGDPTADTHVFLTSIDGEPQSLGWIRDGILDAAVSQDPVAYGNICVEMLFEHSAKGNAVPTGTYENADYYWESAPIEQTEQGPSCVIPPYYIDADNVEDPRHWANYVETKWGMKQ
ncbi:sugar ABC transporter substrate-binding protein [Citricoccus sp. K5]|uniref:sugar ABC transporter substrate-binding protein n=1 Tax=Citricoccus sp. K5 TaxID=2653135 RepID=UPI0012EF60CC|nr:sugar ABC transporter substrate-binding protein [Citricoccus sp. K5]VXB65601.1 Monosaccharide ABC transporter substrate-binding protein, CUT2 family [Citricoccus sp. K5]